MDLIGNITIESARELVADSALWPRIRDFLWDFAPQVHASWIEELEAAAGEEGGTPQTDVQSLAEGSWRIKSWMLSRLGVEPCFHAFPKGDWSRLLLLDGGMIESVATWLGALSCAGDLRKVMDGAAVRKLKAALPGVYPELFRYTAYFRAKVEGLKIGGPDEIAGVGWFMLQSYVKDLPEPMLRRLALKLPKRYSSLQPSTFDFHPETFNLQLLLKLRFPEAYSLCCS